MLAHTATHPVRAASATGVSPLPTNRLPHYDHSVNTTGCCPKFNPQGWDARELHFENKRFVHATTLSAWHVPLNMGRVFDRVQKALLDAGAYDPSDLIVLSHETSPWKAEHYFAVDRNIQSEEMTTLSGDFLTRVFEGPYSSAAKWHAELLALAEEKGREAGRVFFFYTTCPRCAKTYGKNYVVGLVEI